MPTILETSLQDALTIRDERIHLEQKTQRVGQLLTGIHDILVDNWEQTIYLDGIRDWSTTVGVIDHPDMRIAIKVQDEREKSEITKVSTRGHILYQFIPAEKLAGVTTLSDPEKITIDLKTADASLELAIELFESLSPDKQYKANPSEKSHLATYIEAAEHKLEETKPQRTRGRKLKSLLQEIYKQKPDNQPPQTGLKYTTRCWSGAFPGHDDVTIQIEMGWENTTSPKHLPSIGLVEYKIFTDQQNPDAACQFVFSCDTLLINSRTHPLTDAETDQNIETIEELVNMTTSLTPVVETTV
jgi:hypothetical protein